MEHSAAFWRYNEKREAASDANQGGNDTNETANAVAAATSLTAASVAVA